MLKTVLFDLDGTLLDTEADFSIILNKLLLQYGREPVTRMQVRETVSDGARALIKLGFAISEENSHFSRYLDELLSLYLLQIEQTQCQLFDGIADLLQCIEKENKQWGIITNKPSRFTLPLIEKFTNLQTASCIICPDQLTLSKPDPEGLLLACSQVPCTPDQAIYVGDHPRDIEAGINAKMTTIAVSWGYYDNKVPIESWQADKIVSSPEQIQQYLFQ